MTDPKLGLIADRAGVSRSLSVAVWAAILEHASAGEPRGTFDRLDIETLAYSLREPEESILAVINAMINKGILSEDGTEVMNWDKRQVRRERENADDSAERVRRHRDRQRNTKKQDVTPSNAPQRQVTPCNTQIEREIERTEKREGAVETPNSSRARARTRMREEPCPDRNPESAVGTEQEQTASTEKLPVEKINGFDRGKYPIISSNSNQETLSQQRERIRQELAKYGVPTERMKEGL